MEIQVFWPLSRSRRRCGSAVVVIAAVSEPTPGSVEASAVSGGRWPHSGASQRCRCSGVPTSISGRAKKPAEVIRLPMPAQPQFSSSWTMQPVSTSLDPAAADLLGQHERGQADVGRLVHDVERQYDVRLVHLGGDRTDLGARELAGELLDLALLLGSDHGGGSSARAR